MVRALVLIACISVVAGCSGGPSGGPTQQSSPPPALETPAPKPDPDAALFPSFESTPWRTDFTVYSVPLAEIQSGGPPRDGIPPIDRPRFVAPSIADGWLKDMEPVVALQLSGDARAYPIQILIWHEIVNDDVGGVPVSVTFCPLCNTAIAFDRRLGDRVYDFGTTGKLRLSDLVMWDRQTESWWQQATGEAIVGTLTGQKLSLVPASIVSYADFKAAYPDGTVLSRETGFSRSYGRNPYVGYDDIQSSPFLFSGRPDGRLRPMERVVSVSVNADAVAYPFLELEKRGVVMDRVGGQSIAVFHAPGTVSALDRGSIADSRDVGAGVAYSAALNGRSLTFQRIGGVYTDAETASQWNVLGQATAGPLLGSHLQPVVHGNHFWFAIAAFAPGIRVWSPAGM